MTYRHPTILLVDDQALVREGIRLQLERHGFTLIFEASSGRKALEAFTERRPDIVLLDLNLRDMSGLDVLAAMKREASDVRVLILTSSTDPRQLARSVLHGADGYLSKDLGTKHLINAIHVAPTGQAILSREIVMAAVDSLIPQVPSPNLLGRENDLFDELTDQEVRVLRLIGEGMDNHTISTHLQISQNTVKTHIRHIYEKLGVSDRTKAAVWAYRHIGAAAGVPS